jgi:DNA polymerase-3 subunit gamma/tau
MFYLKYRPKTISEIDNSRVRDLLQKILESKNLPHALLFLGEKGTGKTSSARIFAKAVNCLNNKFGRLSSSVEPCGHCSNCASISRSISTDVLEMDAASNRGIEEIKNLIRETAFLPMTTKFRVFIIDEAHMITPDGFNALLKTLEEPPETAIFILATTHPEKVPKTIASRCLRINFGRAKKSDILSMLKRIMTKEGLKYTNEMLALIATHSEHSFRDAAKLLEELTIQKIITLEAAEKFLGVRGKNNLRQMIETGDLKKTLVWIEEFTQGGGDFKNLIEELLDELRLMLLAKKGIPTDEEFQSPLTVTEITTLIKLLMEAYQNLKLTPIESLPLEIAISEFYNQRKKI